MMCSPLEWAQVGSLIAVSLVALCVVPAIAMIALDSIKDWKRRG